MRAYRRFSTLGQMAVSMAVFAVLLLLLESGGLADWAARLDLGPERSVAVPLTQGLHGAVGRLGLERVRRDALVKLARVGWSDDPAAVAAVEPVKEIVESAGGCDSHISKSRCGAHASASVSVPASAAVTAPVRNADAAPAPVTRPGVGVSTEKVGASPSAPDVPKPLPKPLAGGPPLVSRLPELEGVPPGKLRTVALAGDSMMAVGLSSTLMREAPRYKDITLVRAFRSGTGLARPEVFDWRREYPAMLGGTHPDVVLVAIGANDGQGFVADGVTYPFGSAGWQAVYRARVAAYLAMLQADGATVVWLGLPPMKSDVYDVRMALINRLEYQVVSETPGVVWFSTAGVVGDAAGRFQDFGKVRGTTVALRQTDGIHLSDDGAVLVAQQLLPWLAKGRE